MKQIYWKVSSAMIFILIFITAVAQDEKKITSSNDEINVIIDKSLIAMKNNQKSNGAIGHAYEVASTSISGLAFLAAGYQTGRGKYGNVIKKAIDYLLFRARKNKNGYFCEDGCVSRMHGHGFALTFLSYAYGDACVSKQIECDNYKQILMKAIKLSEGSQSQNGGWTYEPRPIGDENSVTVCVIMGLRAAKEAGFKVSQKVIKKGAKYIEDCAQPNGSFSYSLNSGINSGSATLTGAGISDLYFYGRHSKFSEKHKQIIKRGINFIINNKLEANNLSYGMYSLFYTTLAIYFSSDEHWEQWFKVAVETIKSQQKSDGTIGMSSYGVLDTGFATLILLIPKKILPLFDK